MLVSSGGSFTWKCSDCRGRRRPTKVIIRTPDLESTRLRALVEFPTPFLVGADRPVFSESYIRDPEVKLI